MQKIIFNDRVRSCVPIIGSHSTKTALLKLLYTRKWCIEIRIKGEKGFCNEWDIGTWSCQLFFVWMFLIFIWAFLHDAASISTCPSIFWMNLNMSCTIRSFKLHYYLRMNTYRPFKNNKLMISFISSMWFSILYIILCANNSAYLMIESSFKCMF